MAPYGEAEALVFLKRPFGRYAPVPDTLFPRWEKKTLRAVSPGKNPYPRADSNRRRRIQSPA
jgi:hypothetical protein